MDLMLYNAVTGGKVEILSQFSGSQLEVQLTPTNNTALHVAAQSGHIGCVDEILNRCPRLLTSTNVKGETALHIAARKGSADIVKALIDCAKRSSSWGGAEETKEKLLRATNEDKDTALHMAVRMPKPRKLGPVPREEVEQKERGYVEVVRMLIHEDREFQHLPNNAEETPLYIATEREYDEMVSLILTFSENPAYTGPGRNALHAALLSDFTVDTIKKLLEWNPELIKEQDDCGWTPLHCAALKSSPEIVKLLLEKDKSIAYIGTADKDGDKKTALHIAFIRGRVDVMEKLLLNCPDCWEILTGKGQNILHLAMETPKIEVIKFILENPWTEHLINQKDIEGNTPLHLFAGSPRHMDLLEFLEEINMWKVGLNGDWNAFNNKILSPQDVEKSNRPIIEWDYYEFPSLRNIVSNEKDYITKRKKYLHESALTSDEHQKQRIEGERIKRKRFEEARKVGESHLIVAALIATVTFAAGFTLPGGYDGNQGKGQGMAVLAKVAAFKAFVISNTIAVTCSTSAVFLYVMTALYDFIRPSEAEYKMIDRHIAAFFLILIAMGAMMVAFITGAYAVSAHSLGLAITVCVIASLSFLLHFSEVWKLITSIRRVLAVRYGWKFMCIFNENHIIYW